MGPFELIGSFLHAWEWAQSSSSAVSLIEHTGPIQAHRQFFPYIGMGPFKIIGNFLKELNGPIRAHWQFSSCMEMGPIKLIDSFSL